MGLQLGPGAVADPNPIAIRAVKALFGESPNQQVTYAVGAEGKRRRTSLTDLDQIKMLHEANLEKVGSNTLPTPIQIEAYLCSFYA